MKSFKRTTFFATQVFLLALTPLIVAGQNPNSATSKVSGALTGKYEGTAKGPDGEVVLKLDLVDDSGKFSGSVTSPRGAHKIIKGSMANEVLTLELESNGPPAKLTLKQKDDKLTGELNADGRAGPVEFHRVAADEISGDWDAAADAQGQAFPFTLSLKLEGEKVTGSSSSQLGTSTISSGSWKDGKLAVVLESGGGQIALVANLQDGKLVGDYDFLGQMQGKWVAIRKK